MQLDREFDHRCIQCIVDSGGYVYSLAAWGRVPDTVFSSKETDLKSRFDVLIVGHRIIGRG